MSEEIDDGLTAEERAALQEDDGGAAPYEEDNDADTKEAGTADDKAADDAAAAADTSLQQQAAEPATSEDKPEQAPILVAEVPPDLTAKFAEIGTKKDALLEQFDNGDITAREYQKQLDALAREERALERQQDRAELAQQMQQQQLQNDWVKTCNDFVSDHPIYKEARLYRALDQEVRELAAKPETANWSGQKFLDEAHKNLKAAFGFTEANEPKPKVSEDRGLPPNLAKVPAAEVESTNGGRWAVLDRLAASNPIAYEEAINKMSAAERDAYMAS